MSKYRIIYAAVPAMVFVGVWLMWWLWCPEMMNYQEQYQLFLWTGDYFVQRLSMIGGLADYIGEFLVQFYYVAWLGALATAVVLTLLQLFIGIIALKICKNPQQKPLAFILGAIPVVFVLYGLGDENMLMSFPAALIFMCIAVLAMRCTSRASLGLFSAILAIGYVALYWLIGPIAILFLLFSVMQRVGLTHKWIWAIASLLWAWMVIKCFAVTIFTQYPETQLLYGINYYRIENDHPAIIFVTELAVLAVGLWPMLRLRIAHIRAVSMCAIGFILVGGFFFVRSGYDGNKREIFRYDWLVRQGRWLDIIDMAEQTKPTNDFCLQAVNLALGKTGQLGERMFEFPQNGLGSLLAPYKRDNTTCLVTAETFYHLGMINSAFRYNFDLQESIINNRKSGRFMKRMAECLMVNGKLKVAKKYVDMLKKSLYYRHWAREAESLMADDAAIDRHNEYGEKRRLRFKQEMLYYYVEVGKMMGKLAVESRGQNRLAWDYFNAAMLLQGDLPTFVGMYHYAPEVFGVTEIPKHEQEAIAMFWTFGHANFDGLPYPISDKVQQRIIAFAHVYASNPEKPEAWQPLYGDSYWAYFLTHQAQQGQTSTTTEREG